MRSAECGMTQAARRLFCRLRRFPDSALHAPQSALRWFVCKSFWRMRALPRGAPASRSFWRGGWRSTARRWRNWGRGLTPSTTRWRWTASRCGPSASFTWRSISRPGWCARARTSSSGRRIYGLLPKEWGHLHSVGRLDYHSEGLIFLTNDGEFSLHLTHPRYGVRKKYVATVEGRVAEEVLGQFTQGVWYRGRAVEGGKGAAGFGQPGAERGGIGIGPGQDTGKCGGCSSRSA